MSCCVVLGSCIIAHLILVTSGCVCPPAEKEHPQQKYCSAEFLVKGTVTGYNAEGNNMVYKIQVLEVIKTSYSIGHKTEIEVETNKLSCGVILDVGQTYLIMSLTVNACSPGTERWNKKIHQKLKKTYLKCCSCRVETCGYKLVYGDIKDCPSSYRDSCNLDLREKRKSKCYLMKGMCCGARGSCTWRGTKKLSKCLAKG